MKRVSFFKHVNSSLSLYRWTISLVSAVSVSCLIAANSLESKFETNVKTAESLSPYLATLIESSDRPELLRVLQSTSEAIRSDLIVVQGGDVFASSRSLEELDRPFIKPEFTVKLWNKDIGRSEIISSSEIERPGQAPLDATIYIISPLKPIIASTLSIFCGIFFLCVLVSLLSAQQMRKAIKIALRPIDQLHTEIKGMLVENISESAPIQIRELEEIRNTVRMTKMALENAKDQIAESKAKKLSTEAYKRLIHDLHNPVSALRQMSSLANDDSQDLETKIEAANSISRLAEQILSQVTAAKKNLENEPIALRELNIINCIRDGMYQAQTLENEKIIYADFESEYFGVPHDPVLLKRALVNLLENGLEAAKSQVRVSVVRNSNHAIIRICDDGIGMDETTVPLYFQGRGQSGKANRQAFGLSSTNHIVHSHGGKLIYKRSDLGGASFEIRLGIV